MSKRNAALKPNAADKANAEFKKNKPFGLEDISDREIELIVERMRRRFVMQTNSHQRCPDRRCRRMRSCAARTGRCLCTDVPPMSRRARKSAKRAFRRSPPRVVSR
jgi:hypothetical protein